MDESPRRIKGATKNSGRAETSASRLMLERRPLKTVALSPPDYKVAQHVLTDSYLEKEVRFAGIVSNIPLLDLDCTNRTEVLRVIDKGKHDKLLPWSSSYEQDAIFSLNAQNAKISRRDSEELLLRLPIHEIAAVCYIRDGEEHILAIKYGSVKLSRGLALADSSEMCSMAVLYCDSRSCSEELCSLISQCFQLVYTDATMHFLDMKLSEVAAGLSIGSSTLRSDKSSANSTPKKEHADHRGLQCISQSISDLNQTNGTMSSFMSRSLPRTMTTTRRSSTGKSDNELSATANKMIQDYMNKLYTKLTKDELSRFAILVRAWHANMPFQDFCERVMELYGPDRKYLLLGMRPFVPERDLVVFEAFLERVGVNNSALSDSMTANGRVYKTFGGMASYNATSVSGIEDDHMMNEISPDLETLATTADMGLSLNGDVAKTT